MYSCVSKAEFSAAINMSHDPSEIILKCSFGAKETLFIIITAVSGCVA